MRSGKYEERGKLISLFVFAIFRATLLNLLSFFFLFLKFGEASDYFPEDVENFQIELTFDLGVGQEKIFYSASASAVKRALEIIELKSEYESEKRMILERVSPNDFINRISIERKTPTERGVKYTFSADVDMKKILFYISGKGNLNYSFQISGCSFEIKEILENALFEYPVSATLNCTEKINFSEKDSLKPSSIGINVKGIVYAGAKNFPIAFEREFLFFGSPPRPDTIRKIFSDEIKSKGISKRFEEINIVLRADDEKLENIINSLSKKAYIFSVIPTAYIKEKEKDNEKKTGKGREKEKKEVKSSVFLLIRYFSPVKEEEVKKLIESVIKDKDESAEIKYVETL